MKKALIRVRNRDGALSGDEKKIVKALLNDGWRNQDIQALLNTGRYATVNSARITEVKQDASIIPADQEEVDYFKAKKTAYDARTGLNVFDDERLIRARESMILAVQAFNSPTLLFKTEVFAVLVNVAWTYLLHEYYDRKGVQVVDQTGHALLLGQMIARPDFPLSKGVSNNLAAIKTIRDEVEHRVLRRSDPMWFSLFQACCLNFDKAICAFFGEKLSLQSELSLALQFSKLNLDQATYLQSYDIPGHIAAIDGELSKRLTPDERADIDYQFSVVYSMTSTSKSKAHIQFIEPGSEEGKAVHNVLLKYKPADELYPHKPAKVATLVSKKAGKSFSSHNHMQAWKKFKARPPNGSIQPGNTNKEYCIYHASHADYTYSDRWVDFLTEAISTAEGYNAIRSYGSKLRTTRT